jgi:hypothetical protein
MGKLASPQQSSFDSFVDGVQRWREISGGDSRDEEERKRREEAARRAQAPAVGTSQQRDQREQWTQGRQPSTVKPGGAADYSYGAIAARAPSFSGPDRMRQIQQYLDKQAADTQQAIRRPGRVNTPGEMFAGQFASTISSVLPGGGSIRRQWEDVGFGPAMEAAKGATPRGPAPISKPEAAARTVGSVGSGVVRGTVTMGGYALQGVGQQSARLFGGVPEDYVLYRTGKEVADEAQERLSRDAMIEGSPTARFWAETVPEGFGSIAPFLVAGSVVAPVALAAVALGAPAAVAAKIGSTATFAAPAILGYLIGAGASYDEALERGLDQESAMAAANLSAPAYILEAVPVTLFLSRIPLPLRKQVLEAGRILARTPMREALKNPTVRRVVLSSLAAAGQGAGTEAVQEFLSAWHTEAVIGSLDAEEGLASGPGMGERTGEFLPDALAAAGEYARTIGPEYARAATDPDVWQEAAVGGIVGGVLGGGGRVNRIKYVRDRIRRREAELQKKKEARDDAKAIEATRDLGVEVPGIATLPTITRDQEGEPPQRPENVPAYLADVVVLEDVGPMFAGKARFVADAQVGGVGVQVLGREGDTVIARLSDDSIVAFPEERVGEASWYQQQMGQVYRREGRGDIAMDFRRREPKTNQEREAFNIAKRMGVNLEFYENRVGGATHLGGLIRDGNTIGVNVTPGSDPVTRLVSHELTEAINKQDPGLFSEMGRGLEEVARREGEKYVKAAGKDQYGLTQMAEDIASNDEMLVKEGLSALMQNANVIRSVGGPGVSVWRRFQALLKRVLASMRMGKNHRVVRQFNEAYRTLARREGQKATQPAAPSPAPTVAPEVQTPPAAARPAPVATTPTQEAQTNAQEVRSDPGQPEVAGQVRPEGETVGREDLQQPAQARPAAGDAQAQPAREVAPEARPEAVEPEMDFGGDAANWTLPEGSVVTHLGKAGVIKIRNFPDVPFRYGLANVMDLTPSHDFYSFEQQPADQYPLSNTNDYANRADLKSEVVKNSAKPDPDRLLSTGVTAQVGPPIASAGGVIPGGNGRTILMQRAHEFHPDKFAEVNAELKKKAKVYGLDPADVGPDTVLVRLLDPSLSVEQLQALVDPLNRSEEMRSGEAGVARAIAGLINEKMLGNIEVKEVQDKDGNWRTESFAEALSRDGVDFYKTLIAKGVISDNLVSEYVNQKAGKHGEQVLTDYGTRVLQRAILGYFVKNDSVVKAISGTPLETALFRTLGPMLGLRNLVTDGKVDTSLDITQMVPVVIERLVSRGRKKGAAEDLVGLSERELTAEEEMLTEFYRAAQANRRAGIAAGYLAARLSLAAKDSSAESQMFESEPFAPDIVKEIRDAIATLIPGVERSGDNLQFRPTEGSAAFKPTHTMGAQATPVQILGQASDRMVARTADNRVALVKGSAITAIAEAKPKAAAVVEKPKAKAPAKKAVEATAKPGVVPEGLPESILVEGGRKTTVGDIAEFYINHPDVAEATKAVLADLNEIVPAGTVVVIAPKVEKGVSGRISIPREGEPFITIFKQDADTAKWVAQTLAHEVAHLATVNKMRSDEAFKTRIGDIRMAVRELVEESGDPAILEAVEKLKDEVADEGFFDDSAGKLVKRNWGYGLETDFEFVAESLSNPAFQRFLDSIPSAKGSKVTAWAKLVQALRSALGLKVSDSVLAETLEVLAKHVNPGGVAGIASTTTATSTEAEVKPAASFLTPPKLPAHLSKEASRYGYKDKNYELDWASDVDRAAYVVAKQRVKSKAHDEFLKWGMAATGMTEAEFIAHGERIKTLLKMDAASGDPSKGPLRVRQLWYPPQAALQTGRRGLASGKRRHSSLFTGTITEDVYNPKSGEHINMRAHIQRVLDDMGVDARDAVTGMPKGSLLPVQVVLGKILDAQTERRLSGAWNDATATLEIDPTSPDYMGAIAQETYHAAEDRVLSIDDVARIERALKGTVETDFAKATAEVTDGTIYLKRLVEAVMGDSRLNNDSRARVLLEIATDPAERRAYAYQYYVDGKLDPQTVASRLFEYAKHVLASLKPFQSEAPISMDTFWALSSGQYRRPNPKLQRGIIAGLANEILKAMQQASSRAEASDPIGSPPRSAVTRAVQRGAGMAARWMLATSVMGGTTFARLQSAVTAQKLIGAMERWALTRRLSRAMKNATPDQREGMSMIVFGDVASRSAYAEWNHPALKALTEEQRNAALDMRHGVDTLSKVLLAKGMPSEQVQAVVDENIGSYIARAYQLDHKPGWTHRVRVQKPEVWRKAVNDLAMIRRLKQAGFDWGSVADAVEAAGPQGEIQASFIDQVVQPDDKLSKKERDQRKRETQDNLYHEGVDLITGQRTDRNLLPPEIYEKIMKLRGKPVEDQELEIANGELYRYMRLRETKGMRGDGAHSIPLDRLRRRKDIPESFKEVWGEIKDPPAAADRTLHELNEMIARYDLFAALALSRRDDGTRYAYDDGDPEAVKAGAIVQLGSRQSRKSIEPGRYGLLEGKWVTREVADQIDTISQSTTGWLATVDRNISMPFKIAQTILSTGTHMRNTIGNAVTFAMYAGVSPFNPRNSRYYLRAMAALNGPDTVTGRILNEFAETRLGKIMGAVKASGPTGQDYRLAARDGALAKQFFSAPETQRLVRDSERIQGEWSKAWADRLKIDPMAAITEPLTDNFITRGGRNFVDWAKTLYMAEDQVFRLAAFFKRYDNNGGDTKEASDWVNMFFPDYSRIPLLVQVLQKTPLVAPFLSFMMEMPRIHTNLATQRPIMALGTLFFWSALLSFFLDDEDTELFDKARHLLPEYYRHNNLMAYRGSDGKPRYVNMDNVVPFLGFKGDIDKISSVLGVGSSNRNPRHALLDYLGGGPLADIIAIGMLGTDTRGRTVVAGDASSGEVMRAMAWSTIQKYAPPLFPGIGYEYQRLRRGIAGETDKFGRTANTLDALTGVTTGLRPVQTQWDAAYLIRTRETLGNFGNRVNAQKRVLQNNPTPQQRGQIAKKLTELRADLLRMESEMNEALMAALRMSGSSQLTSLASENYDSARRQWKAKRTEVDNLIRAAVTGE